MLTPWTGWEDWRAGMYVMTWTDEHVTNAGALLADPDQFAEVAREMIREWPNAAQHNLSHMWSGRNAWIGQASALYCHGAPAGATRVAWGQLTNAAQRSANRIAERVRDEWERGTRAQTLFAL